MDLNRSMRFPRAYRIWFLFFLFSWVVVLYDAAKVDARTLSQLVEDEGEMIQFCEENCSKAAVEWKINRETLKECTRRCPGLAALVGDLHPNAECDVCPDENCKLCVCATGECILLTRETSPSAANPEIESSARRGLTVTEDSPTDSFLCAYCDPPEHCARHHWCGGSAGEGEGGGSNDTQKADAGTLPHSAESPVERIQFCEDNCNEEVLEQESDEEMRNECKSRCPEYLGSEEDQDPDAECELCPDDNCARCVCATGECLLLTEKTSPAASNSTHG